MLTVADLGIDGRGGAPPGMWSPHIRRSGPKNTLEASRKALWWCKGQVHRWQPTVNLGTICVLTACLRQSAFCTVSHKSSHVSKIIDYPHWCQGLRSPFKLEAPPSFPFPSPFLLPPLTLSSFSPPFTSLFSPFRCPCLPLHSVSIPSP